MLVSLKRIGVVSQLRKENNKITVFGTLNLLFPALLLFAGLWILIIILTIFTCNLQIKADSNLAKNSKSAVLMESLTGEVVFSKDEHTRRSPASMTKIMSLKIIFDSYSQGAFKMDDIITTSEYASSMGGSQIFLSVEKMGKYKVSYLCKM
mgnify:CR=1 FL=1